MTTDLKTKIMEYYTFLDEGEVDKTLKIFSSDAVYKRCEEVYLGKREIVEFFTKKLTLKGTHTILKINQDDDTITVRGIFEGVNGESKEVREFFCDIFTFNKEDLVYTRETYLARGSQIIS